MQNDNAKIAKASFVLVAASILGHSLGIAKEMLVATRFGITASMDAFYAAVTIPNLCLNVFLSTFTAILIPLIARARTVSDEEADRVSSIALRYAAVMLFVASFVLYFSGYPVIRFFFPDLSSENLKTAGTMFRFMSFTVLFSGLTGTIISIINARERFTLPALSPMIVTASTIAALLMLSRSIGIYALIAGLLAGTMLQLLFIGTAGTKGSFSYKTGGFGLANPGIVPVLSRSFILVTAVIVAQLNVLVSRIMAGTLPSGSIAALGYADRLVQAPVVIFTASIATAVFPYLSLQAAENRIEEMRESVSRGIVMIGYVFIPMTVLAVVFARPLIRMLFQRGAFTPEATDLTAVVFACYSLQIVFVTISALLGRVFLSLQSIRPFVKTYLFSIALTVALNLIFMRVVQPPVAGIALATSAVQFITALMFAILLRNRLPGIPWQRVSGRLAVITALSVTAGLVALYGRSMVMRVWTAESTIAVFAQLLAASAAAAFVYVGLSYLMKCDELNLTIQAFKKAMRPERS